MKVPRIRTWRRRGSYVLFGAAALQFAYGLAIGFYESFMPMVSFVPASLGLAALGLALYPKKRRQTAYLRALAAGLLCLAGAAVAGLKYTLLPPALWDTAQSAGCLLMYLACLLALDTALDPARLSGGERFFRVTFAVALPLAAGWAFVLSMMRLD